MREHFDGISFLHVTGPQDMRVEAQSSAKSTNDVAEHAGIPLVGVRVVRCHDAAATEVRDCDFRVRQCQRGAGPLPLSSAIDTCDEDVRAQPSDITTKHRHGAVGAYEQRRTPPTSSRMPKPQWLTRALLEFLPTES